MKVIIRNKFVGNLRFKTRLKLFLRVFCGLIIGTFFFYNLVAGSLGMMHTDHPWRNLFKVSHWSMHGIYVVVLLVAIGGYALYEFVESHKRTKQAMAEADWNQSLDNLVDVKDFAGTEDLYTCLAADERNRLFYELQRMPRGSRSLYKAVQIVCPAMIQ